MLMELARGPLVFHDIIEIETALTEQHFDLNIGSRGFRIQVRPTSGAAVLRISNIKGEVAKAITDTPKPKFWTVPENAHFEGFLGLRVMVEDAPAPDADGNAIQVAAGEVREQRWYVTSEEDDTEIEIIEVPGS